MEYNRELHLVFVDQENAFDRIDRDKLWKVLEMYNISGQLLDNIKALYAGSKSAVRTPNGLTKWFCVKSGVRQGCVLSPLLFIIYMDRITKEANPEPDTLNELLFADDQVIINENNIALQQHTEAFNQVCKKYGMKISTSKTETMTVCREPKSLKIKINENILRQTREFKYLGSLFTADGRLDREVEIRCQKANAVCYQLAPLLKHKNIPVSIKARLIKTIFYPTLTYQCQTWALTKTLQQKLVTCEMRCLRMALNKSIRDKIRNEDIRAMLGVKPVTYQIAQERVKWFGHLTRMQTDQPALRAYTQRYSGGKARGRPRTRWVDNLKITLNTHGISMTEANALAAERKLFLPTTLVKR